MPVFAVNTRRADVRAAHVAIPVTEVTPDMTVVVTEFDDYRDPNTDELHTQELTWAGQILDISGHYSAPSEVLLHFYDGPGAWVLKTAVMPVVQGPVNKWGRF